jgi:hypothetical protein
MTKVRKGKLSSVSEAPIATRELNSSSARLEDAVPLSARGKERLRMGITLRRKRQKIRPPEVE